MNRTLALYGLAGATLVGAFLLVPRAKHTAPIPEPPVVHASVGPITRLVASDAALSFDARLDRGAFLRVDAAGAQASEPLYLDIAVRAVDSDARAPITAVLVIDRSGSMAGDGIENARFSADRFIRRLADGDRLAVVSYATDVTVDFQLQEVTATSRTEALRTVARIEEGGGTNIEGGLQAAARMLERAAEDGSVRRLILVSDGRPTEGSRDERTLTGYTQRLRAIGVSSSALGVGLDYNEDLMARLADEGGGRYHYLREPKHLAKILDDELSHAAKAVARDVVVELPSDLGGFLVESVPGYAMTSGSVTRVMLGDLAAGEERRVLVALTTPTVAEDRAFQFAGPTVRYKTLSVEARAVANPNDAFRVSSTTDATALDESRRGDVLARVLQYRAAETLERSMNDYAKGDVQAAKKNIEDTRALMESANRTLKDKAVADELANLSRVYDETTRPASSTEGAALQKEQKARAYGLRR